MRRVRGLAFALFLTAAFVAVGNWFDWGRPRTVPPATAEQDFALPPLNVPSQPAPAPTETPKSAPSPEVRLKADATSTDEVRLKADTTSTDEVRLKPDTTSAGDQPPEGRGARAPIGRLGPSAPLLLMAARKAPPETFDLVFAANDPDSRNLALQIRSVLTAGGWTNASTTEIAEPQARIGIFAPRETPGVSALTNWAIRSGFEPDIRRDPNLKNPQIVIGKQQ